MSNQHLRLTGAAVCAFVLVLALAASAGQNHPNAPANNTGKSFEITAKLPKGVKEGTVVVRCVVTRDGEVAEAKIHRSLSRDADAKALAAVKKWRFEPAKKDGRPVAVQIEVAVHVKNSEP